VVDLSTVERCNALIEDALAHGATLVCGGTASNTLMPATLLDHVTPAMRIYREEAFAPVKGIVRVDGVEAAVACANDNAYGLSAAVFGHDIARALLMLLERAKQVVEPAGAVGVAAILAGKVVATGPTVSVLSGGNIDPLLLQRVVAHGLSASGRYMSLQIPLPDRPGQLARVSELLAQAGANVIEVLHTRHGQGLQISEVILQLSVETRGEEHRAHVIATLEAAGYTPTVMPD
jgi:threonine synthase